MSIEHELVELLYRHDPVGLAEIGAPEDEYSPEAKDVLARLREANSEEHLREIIHAIFVRQFGGEDMSGPESAYDAISHEIWTRFIANKSA